MKWICKAQAGLKCDYRRRQDKEGYNECLYEGDCNQQQSGVDKVKEMATKLEVNATVKEGI